MRHIVAVSVIVLTLAIPSSAYAAPPPPPPLNAQVTGPFSGAQLFFYGAGCDFVRQFFNMTYETSGGTGALHIDACVEIEGETNYTYDGTFTLTTPRGATVTGAMQGTLQPQFIPVPFDAVLAVQTGTRDLRRVTGSIDMSGTWTLFDPDTTQGPTVGTLSGELARITGAGASS